jgi:hypothetical protein
LGAVRGYFHITPASADARPALAAFRDWLAAQASAEADSAARR